jgi:uncharacterized protein YndB with AHSA1/START domain
MGPISVTRAIDAPRDRVFDFVCDLANRPAFTDHFIGEFRLERLDSDGVGAAARMRVGRRLWMETEIVEASRPHRIMERGRGGRWNRTPTATGWEFVPRPGGSGCDLTLSFLTEPPNGVDRLRERLGRERFFRRQWSIALSRLKDLIESGSTPERVVVAGGDRVPVT